jgi:battenin
VYLVSPLRASPFSRDLTLSAPSQLEYTINQVSASLHCRVCTIRRRLTPHLKQGIAPTLIYPVPTAENSWLLSRFIHSIRDYYPLWQVRFFLSPFLLPLLLLTPYPQLVYQTTVFLSRSSISLGLPALPSHLLPLPAMLQSLVLMALLCESALGLFGQGDGGAGSIVAVFSLVCVEGICGGLA